MQATFSGNPCLMTNLRDSVSIFVSWYNNVDPQTDFTICETMTQQKMQVLIVSNVATVCKIFDLFMKGIDKLSFPPLENQRWLSTHRKKKVSVYTAV